MQMTVAFNIRQMTFFELQEFSIINEILSLYSNKLVKWNFHQIRGAKKKTLSWNKNVRTLSFPSERSPN